MPMTISFTSLDGKKELRLVPTVPVAIDPINNPGVTQDPNTNVYMDVTMIDHTDTGDVAVKMSVDYLTAIQIGRAFHASYR